MRTTNRWGSRYGECFVSLPSIIKQSNLEYEELVAKTVTQADSPQTVYSQASQVQKVAEEVSEAQHQANVG